MLWEQWLFYLLPYDVSPLTISAFLLVAVGYGVGVRRLQGVADRPGILRQSVFYLGLLLCYAVMQTRLDYFSQYLFFAHRGQHLILHHLGPLLIALSNPLPVLRLLKPWTERLPQGFNAVVRGIYRVLQFPPVAAFLFVGLIYFWLWPEIHFDAMLSRDLYWVMNWSMFIDGLLFWWLVLDSREPHEGGLGYMTRIVMLGFVMFPQIALGAWITLGPPDLYDVYAVCGRAVPISPELDQFIGGVITWVPPAMMSIAGILIILRRIMNPKDVGASKQDNVANTPSGQSMTGVNYE
jgi:putative membrane protein